LPKNVNIIESIKKIIQEKLKISKIPLQKLYKDIEKTDNSEDSLNLHDFQLFLSVNLGLFDLLPPDKIGEIFDEFDKNRDGKLSYFDFLSVISSKDQELEKLKELLNNYMVENKINSEIFFRKCDKNCDNFLDFDEFKGFFLQFKDKFTDNSLVFFFEKLDKNHDKRLELADFEDFLQENEDLSLEMIVFKLSQLFDNSAHFADIFDKIDTDGSGAINYHEFISFFQRKGVILENKEFQMLFKFFDKNSEGKIGKNSFNRQFERLLTIFSQKNLNFSSFSTENRKKTENFQFIQPILEKIVKNNTINRRELYVSFVKEDWNQDGLVSFGEFREAMKKAGVSFEVIDAKILMKSYDKLGSGFIEFENFLIDLLNEGYLISIDFY